MASSFDIRENLKRLPAGPGVYLHKDSFGDVIYVGKASSLKTRVRQYFAPEGSLDAKTLALSRNISEFEYIVTNTEAEALILENTLIKKYQPRYNVMLLDDKTYPYLKITFGEPFPRIVKTRVLASDGSKYFGPYADVGALNRIIELLNDSYRLKRCSRKDFPADFRPCLNGFIGACDRCCTEEAPAREEYMERIAGVAEFLKGRDKRLVQALKARMDQASDAMDFETAAKCRDLISAAAAVTERQKVDLLSSGSVDVCLATEADTEEKRHARVTVFFVRDGRLTGREIHYLETEEKAGKQEVMAAFLKQYYANQTMIPKEIILEEKIEDAAAIENYLAEAAGRKVRLLVPERGDKRALLDLAKKDISQTQALAEDLLVARKDREEAAEEALRQIAGLPADERPLRIEAYDISHTGGDDSVGAMVVFRGADKSPKDYRRFKIRTVDDEGRSADDCASMQEVLYRRLKRGLSGDKSFDELPDVILVDGGKGQISAAEQVIEALGLEPPVPVLGMVKDERHRTRGLISGEEETGLKDRPELYRLIGAVQEEVHRFTVEYHRGVRGRRMVEREK